MKTYKIKLNEISKIKDFYTVASLAEGDVDVISGRYIIDGKSLMGLYSLDISKEIEVKVHEEDTASFEENLKKYGIL